MKQNYLAIRLLGVLALVTVVAGVLWHFINPPVPKSTGAPYVAARSDFQYHYNPPALPSPAQPVAAEPDTSGRPLPPQISRAKAEEWLARNHRDAASLLTVFRALGDTNYLNEAATNFPNDPRVELAVLAHEAFPGDRRQWLDRFKASSPDNSLADYFSAEDHLKNGNTEAAIDELVAASDKTQFDNYETESRLDAEQLYTFAGKNPVESSQAALADMSAEALPELATFKRLAMGISDLQKQSLAGGDAASAADLAQMGMTLGNHLTSDETGKYAINQLVGMATEVIVLSQLDQNTGYDFLNGQTPAQVQQQLKEQKAGYRDLTKSFQAIYPELTADELAGYLERSKIYGEMDAMRWVVQQHPPPGS